MAKYRATCAFKRSQNNQPTKFSRTSLLNNCIPNMAMLMQSQNDTVLTRTSNTSHKQHIICLTNVEKDAELFGL